MVLNKDFKWGGYGTTVEPVNVSTPPTLEQLHYRWYQEGTESGSTALANEDTTFDFNLTSANQQAHLRLGIDETAGFSGSGTDDYQLQFRINGGTYTNLTTTSTGVKAYASANLTDGGATTDRTTGLTNSGNPFIAGEQCEDGLVDNFSHTALRWTEHLFTVEFVKAELADNDSIDFRILRNGSTITTYTVTPNATINESSGLSGNLGLNSETDETLAPTRLKEKVIGLNEETDATLALTTAKSAAISFPEEVDTLSPFISEKSLTLGIATELDEALGPVTPATKTRSMGLPEESDSTLALSSGKSKVLGLCTESDASLPFQADITAEIGLLIEINTALPIGKWKDSWSRSWYHTES